jgi:hypothetical protein
MILKKENLSLTDPFTPIIPKNYLRILPFSSPIRTFAD